jgi:hypothetical protein
MSFSGINTSSFTVTTDLLRMNHQVQYWRFEVVYALESMQSVGVIEFIVNSPPTSGNCSTDLLNGTTSALLTITCSNWSDVDGIQDYSFYSMAHCISRFESLVLSLRLDNRSNESSDDWLHH